jgi:hypothetical protein
MAFSLCLGLAIGSSLSFAMVAVIDTDAGGQNVTSF